MAGIQLAQHQLEALSKMKNGCILNGGVGSGKSRTAIAYYYIRQGGQVCTKGYVAMKHPKDLYIITTARKRDDLDWELELPPFHLTTDRETGIYRNKVFIDSWNNIKKYADVKDAFFIFDEQRVCGYGAWTKTFLKIARNNEWILLTATPGDTWEDYIPVFIANGFYKNKTDFVNRHIIYSRFSKYPKVDRYINEGRLIKLKAWITIPMEFERNTIPSHEYVTVDYDRIAYNNIVRNRWNPTTMLPIKNAAEYCQCLRRVVNSSFDRRLRTLQIVEEHPKAIIFYTYDYELEILRNLFKNYPMAEWNGHKHEPVPEGDRWVYLVEYISGNEGWNCITTDTIIFYSLSYSYKVMTQACGRIDRMNTPYVNLYYFYLRSNSPIDMSISSTLKRKKKFNEKNFAPDFNNTEDLNERSKQIRAA